MRGTRLAQLQGCHRSRIIPADAGNTELLTTYDVADKDHPRGCGEHHSRKTRRKAFRGSSPRMRGTHHVETVDIGGLGIIPADAGNTWHANTPNMQAPDHPRGCGEHQATTAEAMANQGSSPRMRGTHILPGGANNGTRIIPADAGNTRVCWQRPGLCEDHPRGCGEH